MSELQLVFNNSINKATLAAKEISDPFQKASAYSAIAKAIALTGVIGLPETRTVEQIEYELAMSKKNLENKPNEKAKPATKVAAIAAADPKEEDNDWNADTSDKYKKELAVIDVFVKRYGNEYVDQLISEWSSAKINGQAEVKPFNIVAVSGYFEQLQAERIKFVQDTTKEYTAETINGILAQGKPDNILSVEDINEDNIFYAADFIESCMAPEDDVAQ